MRIFWILITWWLLSLSSTAEAQSSAADRSNALKAEADAAMADIRYEEALGKYQEAYKLSANPALLYNQGRALEALGRLPEALEMLKQFDAKATPELHARVPNLQKLIEEVEKGTTLLTVTVDRAGASIRLNDRVIGAAPLAETRVNAGNKVKLEVSADGYETFSELVDLPRGGKKAVSVTLTPKDKTGILIIESPVKGATVSVNGGAPRQVPTEVKLPTGKHTIELKASGYRDNVVDVVVAIGEKKTVTIEPGEPPVYERWWFWTIIGGANCFLGGGAMTEIDLDDLRVSLHFFDRTFL